MIFFGLPCSYFPINSHLEEFLGSFQGYFFAKLVLKGWGVLLFIVSLAFVNTMKIFTSSGLLFFCLTWSAKWSYL